MDKEKEIWTTSWVKILGFQDGSGLEVEIVRGPFKFRITLGKSSFHITFENGGMVLLVLPRFLRPRRETLNPAGGVK